MAIKKAPAKKPAAKKPAAKKPAAKKPRQELTWLDDKSVPQIDTYARKTEAFLKAMADDRIDEGEVKDQEKRLVALMKEVEPLLTGPLHAKVTRLLCELTVYSIMQVMGSLQETRPPTRFHG
jgi:hypothetical protein